MREIYVWKIPRVTFLKIYAFQRGIFLSCLVLGFRSSQQSAEPAAAARLVQKQEPTRSAGPVVQQISTAVSTRKATRGPRARERGKATGIWLV